MLMVEILLLLCLHVGLIGWWLRGMRRTGQSYSFSIRTAMAATSLISTPSRPATTIICLIGSCIVFVRLIFLIIVSKKFSLWVRYWTSRKYILCRKWFFLKVRILHCHFR
uniref:Uncharacterized protein n=1 Tax=Panstrongylus lignarius TaxID=156445 RepID=A0A224Y2B6_9HEMI